jgi:hypothetical protein
MATQTRSNRHKLWGDSSFSTPDDVMKWMQFREWSRFRLTVIMTSNESLNQTHSRCPAEYFVDVYSVHRVLHLKYPNGVCRYKCKIRKWYKVQSTVINVIKKGSYSLSRFSNFGSADSTLNLVRIFSHEDKNYGDWCRTRQNLTKNSKFRRKADIISCMMMCVLRSRHPHGWFSSCYVKNIGQAIARFRVGAFGCRLWSGVFKRAGKKDKVTFERSSCVMCGCFGCCYPISVIS